MFIELIGGLIVNSVALLSDAWHMSTHAFSICIALIAIWIARNPPCHHKTYGLYRAEVLAAFVNGLFLIYVVITIVLDAINRILNPSSVNGFYMFLIGLVGLIVNITSILILKGTQKSNINVKGVFYHMIGDATSSIGVIFAAIIIFYTGWTVIDPIIAIFISILILFWAWKILKESTRILLEMAPKELNIDTISTDLKNTFPEIIEIYNSHLWTITSTILIFSTYVKIQDNTIATLPQTKLLVKMNEYLKKKFKITESTIQVSSLSEIEVCEISKH